MIQTARVPRGTAPPRRSCTFGNRQGLVRPSATADRIRTPRTAIIKAEAAGHFVKRFEAYGLNAKTFHWGAGLWHPPHVREARTAAYRWFGEDGTATDWPPPEIQRQAALIVISGHKGNDPEAYRLIAMWSA